MPRQKKETAQNKVREFFLVASSAEWENLAHMSEVCARLTNVKLELVLRILAEDLHDTILT